MPETLIDFKGLPTAEAFFFSPKSYSQFWGGVRNGKTTAACAKVLFLSLAYPGNRFLIGRKEYTELKDSTLRVFNDLLAHQNGGGMDAGPVLKSWNKADQVYILQNGSEIWARHLAEFERIKGSELGGFYLDEAEEVPEETYIWLESRLTYWNPKRVAEFEKKWTDYQVKAFGGYIQPRHYALVTGNPDPGWVKKRFKNDKTGKYKVFEASSYENKHNLPAGFLEDLARTMPEAWVDRFLKGSWDVFKGQIYPEFDPAYHCCDQFNIPAHWNRVIALDHGFNNPTAVLFCAIDEEGTWYVYDEIYESGKLVAEHAEAIRERCGRERGVQWGAKIKVFMDPSTQGHYGIGQNSVMDEYLANGIHGIPANNHVDAGILRVKQLLQFLPDRINTRSGTRGAPMLFIMRDRCPHLVEELATYEWDEGQTDKNNPEKPRKVNDHAVDALRYAIMSDAARAERPKLSGEFSGLVPPQELVDALNLDRNKLIAYNAIRGDSQEDADGE